MDNWIDVPQARTTEANKTNTNAGFVPRAQEDSHSLELPPGYQLDTSDPDMLVLRRPDGSVIGHFPATIATASEIARMAEEQARSGYSLAQQLEACRAWCATEGYEILEEVTDAGQSGASLERPGMDRVRDIVARVGSDEAVELVVLAQDRDRFAREPAYHYLLRREFEEHGCKLKALNDRGDESPEGELTDGILDQLAKYERAKITERTRRG